MSRHASPDTTPHDTTSAVPAGHLPGQANPKGTRSVSFWAVPVIATLVVLSALAAVYLGGTLKPMTNLHHFPIAVLNEDAGPTGAQVVKAVLAEVDKDAYDVRVLNHDQTKQQLDTAQIYGVAVIPPNFSSKLQAYAKSALAPGRVDRPIIIITTNPRAGTLGAGIAGQALERSVALIDRIAGQRLSQDIAQQAGHGPVPGAVSILLANPIEIKSTVHDALPDGTGNGQSAFYYALLLLVAGFTASLVVSLVADSLLGLVPAAFGPAYWHAGQAKVSRFRALLLKWVLTLIVALLVSGAYLLIAGHLGMPVPNSLTLWLFGVFAITAVGIASTSLIAVLGGVGALAGLFVFVIIGLPAAGSTVPLQASPQFFTWLATVDPMHQVFLGTRALLYLDGRADAGLSESLLASGIGQVVGLLIGAVLLRLYDSRGYHVVPATAPVVAKPAAPAATAAVAAEPAVTETTAAPEVSYPEE
jgi:ABC-type multidrug transport system permease subunit